MRKLTVAGILLVVASIGVTAVLARAQAPARTAGLQWCAGARAPEAAAAHPPGRHR